MNSVGMSTVKESFWAASSTDMCKKADISLITFISERPLL